MPDDALYRLCEKASDESNSSEAHSGASFEAIEKWLNDNKDNYDLIHSSY
jgi:hypothetical protein